MPAAVSRLHPPIHPRLAPISGTRPITPADEPGETLHVSDVDRLSGQLDRLRESVEQNHHAVLERIDGIGEKMGTLGERTRGTEERIHSLTGALEVHKADDAAKWTALAAYEAATEVRVKSLETAESKRAGGWAVLVIAAGATISLIGTAIALFKAFAH